MSHVKGSSFLEGNAMAWIKLTHYVNGVPKPLYLNTGQIVRVADPVGAREEYRANILLANNTTDVIETVEDVMQLIALAPPDA